MIPIEYRRFLGSLVSQLVFELVFASSSSRNLDCEVNPRRYCKAEALGDTTQIELVDVEDVSLRVTSIGLQEGPIAVFGRAVEIVVLLDKLHKLLLNVGQFRLWEFILIWLDLTLLQIP